MANALITNKTAGDLALPAVLGTSLVSDESLAASASKTYHGPRDMFDNSAELKALVDAGTVTVVVTPPKEVVRRG